MNKSDDFMQIERDEADIVTPANYACYHGRGTVATCAPGSTYLPENWYSKFPAKTAPTWNLLKLFDTRSWMLIFLSIFSVTIFFHIAAKIGTKFFGVKTVAEDIILSPFRQKHLQIEKNKILYYFMLNKC